MSLQQFPVMVELAHWHTKRKNIMILYTIKYHAIAYIVYFRDIVDSLIQRLLGYTECISKSYDEGNHLSSTPIVLAG